LKEFGQQNINADISSEYGGGKKAYQADQCSEINIDSRNDTLQKKE
jgi:hypothetical protein